MKLLYLLTLFFCVTLGVTAQSNPNFTLAENGVTCLCPDAAIGESGDLVIDGETKTFTKRNRAQLDALIDADQTDPEIALTCTSGITIMSGLFQSREIFNQNISSWDVSSVTDMQSMFSGAIAFNKRLNDWDVSEVTNMFGMFFRASSFNEDLGNLDVSSVINMGSMFFEASSFNQPLNDWDVSEVTSMGFMFIRASAFNQPLNKWDTSKVTSMTFMFDGTMAYNQDISGWCVEQIATEPFRFSTNSPLENEFKPNWGAVCGPCEAPTALSISNLSTTTVDLTWNVDINETEGYDYFVQTSGSNPTTIQTGTVDSGITSVSIVDLSPNTTYDVYVRSKCGSGLLSEWSVKESFKTESNFILAENGVTCLCPDAEIGESGDLVIEGETKTFTKRNRAQLDALIDADQTDPEIALTCTSGITSMINLFRQKGTFNQDISSWDVSEVTDMNGMLYGASAFNQPLNDWDVSSVTDIGRIFLNALAFNQPLNDWDVSEVTNMNGMFFNARAFNEPINDWDVFKVTNMSLMFSSAEAFNQPLNDWDVSEVTNMEGMFYRANSFNEPLNDWDVSKVMNMTRMFDMAESFNQDISGWCVEQITTEPSGFSVATPLQNDFEPTWGQSCSLEVLSIAVPANETYTEGEELEFSVNFNEAVSVSGSPQLFIIVGSETRQAVYQSGTGTSTLVFSYTIQPGELDTDGIEVDILTTNDGSIQDNLGFNANLILNNIESTTGVLVDSRVELSITELTGDDKIYDGTTEATASGSPVLSGVLSGDDVIISGSPVYTFASPNVATDIDITTSGFSLSGADSANYTLVQPTLSADITDVELSITGLTGDDKIYDGTTEASASGTAVLSGVISGDEVNLSGTPIYTFVSSDVGASIEITSLGFTLSGADAGNYTLTQPILSADILSAELSITGLSGVDKTYDGTTDATTDGSSVLSGIVSGDDVNLTGTPVFTFISSDVGTSIEITTSGFDLSGTDSENYFLVQPSLSSDITAAEVSITGLTGDDKAYDGTTEASASGSPVLSGVLSGDEVNLSGTPVYTFDNADVGTGIDITTSGFSLSGADSSNYTLVQPTLSADITDVELSITGLSGDDKVYDGTTEASASGSPVLSGLISGDDVSLAGTPVYTFVNSDVDTGIEITPTGFALSGTDAGNYSLIQPMLSASISPAELVVAANSDQGKVFGSEDPVLDYSVSGFVTGEGESILTGELTREVGEDVGNYAIEPGTLDAGQNYTLSFTSADFEILPATQTGLEFADNTFTYNGTVKSLVVGGEAEDAVVTYENNDQTEAGSYTVEATVTRPNFLDEVLVATLTIDKAEAVITADATQTFTYDGSLKNVIASLNHSETSLSYLPQQGFTDAGTYSITIEAEETPNYLSATESIELTINKASQSITFDALASRSLEDGTDFQLEATASSGLEVTYTYSFSSQDPAATVTPEGFVELQTSGEIVITASQLGNDNYEPATSIDQPLMITSSNADITSITIDGKVYNSPEDTVYYLIDCNNAIAFVDVNIAAGVNAQINTGTNFSIDTPVPGVYRQEVVVTSQDETQTRTYRIVVEKTFDFDAIVVQKYNNTLVVNNNPETNGGYSFTSYKWYKNGDLVSERQTFSEGNLSSDQLDPNANYQAVMVTTSGDELRTCNSLVQLSENQGLSLHQNPVRQGDLLKATAQYSEEELENATFKIYDLNGRMLLSVPATGVENTIQLPSNLASGLYKLILSTDQRRESISFIRQ